MSYDIYGNPLKRGYCEVHPGIGEGYPCVRCINEANHRLGPSPDQCQFCTNGQLWIPCCGGKNCSCGGELVFLGACRECNGSGYANFNSNGTENSKYIRSFGGYLGNSLDGTKRLGEK